MGEVVRMPGTDPRGTKYKYKYKYKYIRFINYINTNINIFSSPMASTLLLWYECQLKNFEPYERNERMKEANSYLSTLLKDYELEEIHQAIKNYAQVMNNPNCYYSYSFKFNIFLKYGYQDFLESTFELEDYLRWEHKSKNKAYEEQQGANKQLVSQALACFRNIPGCFSDSKKEVCVVCRKYR